MDREQGLLSRQAFCQHFRRGSVFSLTDSLC
jgi:hypothetical protein